MKKRRKEKITKEHISRELLLNLLKAGAVLAVAVTAPNALRMVAPLTRKQGIWEDYYPSSIERTLKKLWRRGFVDVKEGANGYTVTITDKGQKEILRYDIESMSIPKQDSWDGNWRMVFFDISASDKARHVFRQHLKSLGFFPMQKSVYVYPYPCHKQIRYLREIYNIPHSVKLATLSWMENDEELRTFFRISRT